MDSFGGYIVAYCAFVAAVLIIGLLIWSLLEVKKAREERVIYKDDIAGWLTPEYFTDDLDSNQIHIARR